ncbi:MAG: Uncharacterized protein G01um101438_769 [Parcubacteria group bacterium Gr01-1014_38]|nr:MAG: Uncharacterized protein G01um101438_769 [Parcubacteria group bacterium Gr01-1014_38]
MRGLDCDERKGVRNLFVCAARDDGDDAVELNTALQAASDAWNYFPHESLGGRSPAEKVLEHQQRSAGKKR